MKIIVPQMSFAEVMYDFRENHNPEEGSNGWAVQRLEEADRMYGVVWQRVSLTKDEVEGIVLVGHREDKTDPMLVPYEGRTVLETVDYLKKTEAEYASAHPGCHNNILRLSEVPMTGIYLCRGPIEQSHSSAYDRLKCSSRDLVHMDGLHRLVSWVRVGRFDGGQSLEVVLAERLGS